MKSNEAKKLIGKNVTWEDHFDLYRGGILRSGKVIDVKGRNVLIDQLGSTDWKWLPKMADLKESK